MSATHVSRLRRTTAMGALVLLLWSVLAVGASREPAVSLPPVLVVQVDGIIGPAAADFIHRSLGQAQRRGSPALVLRMDTPGGLDDSMRRIIKDILASPIPVVTYVAPQGARAASAGTYILYASHIAAMAPATNLGAATPVAIGGDPGGPDTRSGGTREPAANDRKGGGKANADGEAAEAVRCRVPVTRCARSPSMTPRPTSARSRSCAAATPSSRSRPCCAPPACRLTRP